MAIFAGQGMTKYHFLEIFKCQYLVEILRYGSNFLHVIITFIGFKITFSNIRCHGAPWLISRGWRLAPPPPGLVTLRNTLGLKGLSPIDTFPYVFRSGCFSSSYFHGCMESLLIDEDTKGKAGEYMRDISNNQLVDEYFSQLDTCGQDLETLELILTLWLDFIDHGLWS